MENAKKKVVHGLIVENQLVLVKGKFSRAQTN